MFFWNSLDFSTIQRRMEIWSLVPLPFLNSAYISVSSQFTYGWSLAWRILSFTLLACEMSTTVWEFEHSLALPFFGIEMKTDFFQFCGHCWVFQICWHIGCSTFTASSFRIWNSSAGIPSPPLALFVVMLPKAHLSSYFRMSGSRWMTTPSWLSGSLRSFMYSSLYSCHLFLMSSASVRSLPFLSLIVPIPAWNVPLMSQFSERYLYSFPFYCFPPLICTVHWKRPSYLSLLFSGTLHLLGYIFPFPSCF